MTDTLNNQIDEPAGEEMTFEVVQPPTRVRVAWVASHNTLDRLGRTLQPLAIGLLDEMVEVTAICPTGSTTSELPSPPIEVMSYPRMSLGYITRKTVATLADDLSRRKVQVIHALDCSAARMARRLAEAMDVRYVVSCFSLGDAKRLGSLDDAAGAVLAASDPILCDLLEHHVVPVERIHLVRPGIYQVRHTTLFDNPNHSLCIVAGGRLDDFAAFDAVLKCFAELNKRRPIADTTHHPWAFFLIGNGKVEGLLRRQVEKLGLGPVLTFVEQQPPTQLAGIFKAADIYVSPAPSAHLDIQSLLAMAAGDPVLAARGGCSDFLINRETAMVFKPGDVAELTAKLLALLENRADARSLAENALAYLREHHSPAVMVNAMAEVYRHVAQMRWMGVHLATQA